MRCVAMSKKINRTLIVIVVVLCNLKEDLVHVIIAEIAYYLIIERFSFCYQIGYVRWHMLWV